MPNDETQSQTTDTDTDTSDDSGKTPAVDPNIAANAAAKSHIARFSEKVLPGVIAAAMKPLLDEIQALKSKPAADSEDSKGKGKTSPEMAAVQAQLEDMKTRFAAEQSARTAAENKSRDAAARSALKDALAPHVRPELLGILTDNLIVMKQVVEFDEDGTPLFKSKKPDMYGDLEDVRLPLKDGVSQYLKSEEAKAFLPSPGSSGAQPLKQKKNQNLSNSPVDLSTANEETKIRLAQAVLDRARGQ